jgi:ribose/xylose/arabinose/galactoside ABC-type transport system permease subunit
MLGLLLVLLVATFSVLPSFFLIQIFLLAIATDVWAIGAVAAVGTLPIQAGGLDLSIEGVAGLSVVVSLLHATGVGT